MKKIYINTDGFVESPYISNATIPYEVEDEEYEKLTGCFIGKNWRLKDDAFIVEDILDIEVIRERRQTECFALVDNRSQLWWNHLTEEMKNELDAWYEAWLLATETKVIPKKPEWLQ